MKIVKVPEARKRLIKARIQLITSRDLVFFGPLSLRLKLVEDTSGAIPTMATDGVRLIYNPEFVLKLPHPDEGPELRSCICHEVWHCALKHFARCQSRNPTKWNIAGDMVCNRIIEGQHGLRLPECALRDEEGQFKGDNTEQVYAKMPDLPESQGGGQYSWEGKFLDPGGCGGVIPYRAPQPGEEDGSDKDGDDKKDGDGKGTPDGDKGPGGGEAKKGKTGKGKSIEDLELDWDISVMQSAQQAKQMGSHIPKCIERLIDSICHPKIPVEELLRDFVYQHAKNDYSWSKPSRRYASMDMYIPSLVSDELPFGVIAIDTSRSIDNGQLAKFLSGLSDILEAFDTRVLVLYCDTAIRNTEEFTTADLPIKPNPAGGGGTDFRPVFDAVSELDETPAYLLYFTDTYGQFPEEEPGYPVLWVSWSSSHNTPPIGELVVFDDE